MNRTTTIGRGLVVAAAASYATFLDPRSQLVGAIPYRLSTAQKRVALSFDDGPGEAFTSQLVNLLTDREVPAILLQVGRCVERFPDVTRRLAADGHLIRNRSQSHRVRRCIGTDRIRAETVGRSELLTKVLGGAPVLYRSPWLLGVAEQLRSRVRTPAHFRQWSELGSQPVSGLFCRPGEVFQPPARQIARAGLRTVRPGSILIFHDGYNAQGADRSQTVQAIALVIDQLHNQGYDLITVSSLGP